MTTVTWVLIVWNFFHVQQGILGSYPDLNSCQVAKISYQQPFRLPLGNWTECVPLATSIPPPAGRYRK
jgi:hypothetical protein